MIYGYIRVAEDLKSIAVEDQMTALKLYVDEQNLSLDECINETILPSRSYNREKREELFSHLKSGDILLTNKLALLGVNLVQIMHLLQYFLEKKVKIISIGEGFEIGNKVDIKTLSYAFNISVHIEKELLAQRNKKAFESLKEHGTSLGRKIGAKNKKLFCDKYIEKIEDLLSKKVPVIHIAKQIGCSRPTLISYIKNTMAV